MQGKIVKKKGTHGSGLNFNDTEGIDSISLDKMMGKTVFLGGSYKPN
jgi:hypothetical protein